MIKWGMRIKDARSIIEDQKFQEWEQRLGIDNQECELTFNDQGITDKR